MDEQEKQRRARAQVAAMKGFYIHSFVFVLVMTLLLAINWIASPVWWVQWPLLGWGLGVVGHAIAVFSGASRTLKSWEADQVKKLSEKM